MLGSPDVVGCDGSEEQAIFEWGLRACVRQWTNMQAADAFASSVAPPAQPTQKATLRMHARGIGTMLQKPAETISAEDRERIELTLLGRQWGGPRPGSMGSGNDYRSWKALRAVQEDETPAFDGLPPVWVACFGDDIPSSPDWITWIGNDTVLLTDMASLRQAIATVGSDVCVVYGDNDSLVGENRSPEFKPDFDLELLLAQDYITPICAVRMSVFDRVPEDRVDLWSMLIDIALVRGPKAFLHDTENSRRCEGRHDAGGRGGRSGSPANRADRTVWRYDRRDGTPRSTGMSNGKT